MKTVQIIVVSNRPNRAGQPVGNWVMTEASKRSDLKFELLDLVTINLPFLDEPKIPAMGDYEHEHTKRWAETVSRGDAYIIVTPEYNHGYPAVLKNALDTLYAEWDGKPVTFVGYSGSVGAGIRSVEQLLQVVLWLGMKPVRAKVQIPNVHVANDQPFEPTPETTKALESALAELVGALA